MSIWYLLLYQPLLNLLIFFYKIFGLNLGGAIIALTLFVRLAMLPLTAPSFKSAQKMKLLMPELEALKKKYFNNKQKMAKEQLKLYQKYGINPASGCLPQIIQFLILIALFQVFSQFLSINGDIISRLNQVLYPFNQLKSTEINTRFLYLDLTKPDMIKLPFSLKTSFFNLSQIPGFFLLSSAFLQFYSSKIMLPQVSVAEKKAKETPAKDDDFTLAMQKQMLYLMPLFTLMIGFRFASGLVLYWFVFSLLMFLQQKALIKQSKK